MSLQDSGVVIIDYGMGNVGSIANMLKRVGHASTITGDPTTVAQARKIILPGVGAFDHGMKQLEQRSLRSVLDDKVVHEKTDVLGICLGMQLFSRSSEEGVRPGLGWIDADTIRFQPSADRQLRIPHMGWNTIRAEQSVPRFPVTDSSWRFYFVHSYHVQCDRRENVLCTTAHGHAFTSAVIRDNVLGVQFHPEKSHRYGMRLLAHFVGATHAGDTRDTLPAAA